MTSRKLSIIVAGAGIGGLTTAIALRRAGHMVTVYEKASLSHEVGQGITISPNGGRILRNLGLDFQKARMVDFLGMCCHPGRAFGHQCPCIQRGVFSC